LRGRLIGLIIITILLTAVMNGLIIYRLTTSGFNFLITGENKAKATALAPLLEASYAYHGDWRGLTYQPRTPFVPTPTPSQFDLPWESNLNRWQLALTVFEPKYQSVIEDWYRLDSRVLIPDNLENTLYDDWMRNHSLAAVAQKQGIEPAELVEAITQAERDELFGAIEAGQVDSTDQTILINQIKAEATNFVWRKATYFDADLWDYAIAQILNISLETLQNRSQSNGSVVEIALARNISPEQLVTAIIEAEKKRASYINIPLDEMEETMLIEQAHARIFSQFLPTYRPYNGDTSWTNIGKNWLLNTLSHHDENILIADTAKQIIFDSSPTPNLNGEQLPSHLVDGGKKIVDRRFNPPVELGVVVVATTFDEPKEGYIESISWAVLISSIISGGTALLLAWFMLRPALAPVTALTKATRRLATGEETAPLPVNATDELGQMSKAFNLLARALSRQHELRQRLVNDIAHDLKTPLSVINLEIEAAKDGLQTVDDAAIRVQHEIGLLKNLVEDLQWLAETDEGLIALEFEPTDMVALTIQAVNRWQSKAKQIKITLTLTLPSEPFPRINADPARLRQVLGNLLSNALKYTPTGGEVEVTLYQADVATNSGQPKPHIVTTVTNTGDGIGSDDLPHVFDRFYRIDKSRNKNTGGRGLGLAIVRQIVVMHGGWVWVDSKEGQTTTFGYRLPV